MGFNFAYSAASELKQRVKQAEMKSNYLPAHIKVIFTKNPKNFVENAKNRL